MTSGSIPGSPGAKHEYLKWENRDVLFVDLHRELNSLTCRFLRVSCQYIQQYTMKENRS